MESSEATRFTTHWIQAQPTVFAFVSSALRDYSDSEDVVQKVATAAISKFGEYDGSRAFVNWAIGIARFEILRHLRDRGTDRHQYVADALPNIADAFEDLAPELEERRKAVGDCVEQLGDRAREVLRRRYEDGMKSGAIAKAMGLAPGSVSRILARAYEALRDCIGRRVIPEARS